MAPATDRKRKLDNFLDGAPSPSSIEAKKAKLALLTDEQLVDRVIALEAEILALKKQAKAGTDEAASSTGELSEDKLNASTLKLQKTIQNEVKKQMKWQPSCKTGTTKWSYTSGVANEIVFFKAFALQAKDEKGKKWKQKKISSNDFQKAVGDIEARCRYNYLRITSELVTIKWNEDDRMFTVSGTYGK